MISRGMPTMECWFYKVVDLDIRKLDMAMPAGLRLTFYSKILLFSNSVNKGELKSCFIITV